MPTYATVQDVEAGFRELTGDERKRCAVQLEEAAVLIDACNLQAAPECKRLVSCRAVRRLLGDGGQDALFFPAGATQGSATALGYSQSWTMNGGSVGELYLSKLEKKLLGAGDRLGVTSILKEMCP